MKREINMKKEILEQMKSEEFSIKDLTDFYETLKGRLVHITYSEKETNRIKNTMATLQKAIQSKLS